MTDLADDLPPRRKVIGVPPAGEENSAAPDAIWFYPEATFFIQRDKDNNPRAAIATLVVDELRTLHPEARHLVCFTEPEEPLLLELEQYAANTGAKITPFRVRRDHAGETTFRLKEVLGQYGIQFKQVRNIRTVSYLSIHKFVTSNSKLRTIGCDDHEVLGLSLPKDPSFQELVQRRRRQGWP